MLNILMVQSTQIADMCYLGTYLCNPIRTQGFTTLVLSVPSFWIALSGNVNDAIDYFAFHA